MPRENLPTISVMVAVDAVSQLRAIDAIREVQDAYHHHEVRTYGAKGEPDVSLSYVYMGAAGVGLNRWTRRVIDIPAAGAFDVKPGESVSAVEVPVLEQDLVRAQKLAGLLDVPLGRVLSAAVCSGLAVLHGIDSTIGPFEIA